MTVPCPFCSEPVTVTARPDGTYTNPEAHTCQAAPSWTTVWRCLRCRQFVLEQGPHLRVWNGMECGGPYEIWEARRTGD